MNLVKTPAMVRAVLVFITLATDNKAWRVASVTIVLLQECFVAVKSLAPDGKRTGAISFPSSGPAPSQLWLCPKSKKCWLESITSKNVGRKNFFRTPHNVFSSRFRFKSKCKILGYYSTGLLIRSRRRHRLSFTPQIVLEKKKLTFLRRLLASWYLFGWLPVELREHIVQNTLEKEESDFVISHNCSSWSCVGAIYGVRNNQCCHLLESNILSKLRGPLTFQLFCSRSSRSTVQ